MKKILAAKIVIIVFANFINAQQVNTEWVINNFTGFPVGVMIGLDNNENVFVAGQSGDHTKIIITKYDTSGNLIWERFYSIQDLGVVATWLSVDPSGNVIVTGYPRTFSSNPVETGLLTLKYDNNGNLLWDKLISGTWAFAVRSIVDQSGNIYVTGRAWQYTATYDFVTVKYAPDGTQLWFDAFDQNAGFHTPTSMDLDQAGNLFITGGGQSGGLITVMYNSAGVRQWIKEESGTAGQSIRVDDNGGIFITGSFYDVNTGTSNDIRLIKYDYSSNLLWQKFYDFGNSEFGKLVNIDSQSNILITGFGDLPGEFLGWLTAKFDPSGNLLWYNRFKLNPGWEEYPYFALTGPEDEIYITGNVGVVSGGTTYHGLETVRYNPDGSNPWVAEVNLYGGIGKGLVLGADLSLYAVGMFYYSVIKYSQSIPLTTFQLTVNVTNGWNILSIPGLHPTNQNVNTWWQYRDLTADVFKYLGGYQSVTDATPGTGYWMKHTGARTYNTGDEWPAGGIQIVPHTPLAGATGWNLIGGYELSVTAANVTTIPPGLQSGPIYKYSGGYQVATTLDPGYGYWMKLTGAGQIIIPETLAKDGKPVEYFPKDWGKLVLTDATGIIYTLYAVKGETDLSQYELPPAPMAGMFDIRYSSGRIAEDLNSAVKTVEMSGITYPLTVRVEGMEIRLMDETGKNVNVNLKSGEDVVISDARIQKLMVSGEMIPTFYSLEQNYPNPFNPTTKLSFVIGHSSLVTLKVYDVLGNEVATLLNEEKPAGSYEINFNASSLSSGTYFYKLQAGSFLETKKMLLLK